MTHARILLTGADGQLGSEFQRLAPEPFAVRALSRGDLDIRERDAVDQAVRAHRPDWIVNAAAFTAVDRAETDAGLAFAINRDGPAHLAAAAQRWGARMVQVSTDYVFDGQLARPYRPDDTPCPLNVYGRSKLAGEAAVRDTLGDHALILRTAWVYASRGHNFVLTMLRLMRERSELRIVEDQIGTPTSAASLARTILTAMERDITGTHHWTDAGVASWFDFAAAIGEQAHDLGLLATRCRLTPIPSRDYPTPATRPGCVLLDKSTLRSRLETPGRQWSVELREILERLAAPDSLHRVGVRPPETQRSGR